MPKHLKALNRMQSRKLPDSLSNSCIVNVGDVKGWNAQVPAYTTSSTRQH